MFGKEHRPTIIKNGRKPFFCSSHKSKPQACVVSLVHLEVWVQHTQQSQTTRNGTENPHVSFLVPPAKRSGH